MAEQQFKAPYFHTVSGIVVPVLVRRELVDKMKAMAHYPDDVWIVGSFRTGNIWVSQIVKLIRNNGVQDDTRITTAVPWPECSEDTSDVPLDQLPRS